MIQKRHAARAIRIIFVLFFILICFSIVQAEEGSSIRLSRGQTVYIPIYSHIYGGDRESPVDLAATLSIRNTDLKHPITLLSVDYYDSKGKLIQGYIEKPIQLNALASARYVIKESDKSGGSGANFIVKWKSEHHVNIPIMESVMIGTKMQQGISFTSTGRVIEEASKRPIDQ